MSTDALIGENKRDRAFETIKKVACYAWGGLCCALMLRVTGCGLEMDKDHDGFFDAAEINGQFLYDCDDQEPSVTNGVPMYEDADGDNLGNASSICYTCPDTEGQCEGAFVSNSLDCDDEDEARTVGRTYYWDDDRDGLGDPDSALSIYICVDETPPTGYVSNKLDCDDERQPGSLSETDPLASRDGMSQYIYPDRDGDGFGRSEDGILVCEQADAIEGYVQFGGDCDDGSDTVYPTKRYDCGDEDSETTRDNDCDGTLNEDEGQIWYFDADEDGFGDPSESWTECPPPDTEGQDGDWVSNDQDCDDTDPLVFPGTADCIIVPEVPEEEARSTEGSRGVSWHE